MRGFVRTRLLVLLPSALCLAGCGSNFADVPPELLDAIANLGSAVGYPPGPYGTGVGDVVQDLCWEAWKDPKADGYDPSKLKPLCLSDFHAEREARLLLVNSSAIWCVACRAEYGGSEGANGRPSLADHLAERRNDGFRVLGTMFQDAASEPATGADAAQWARTYSIDFPFAVDDDHHLGLFTTSSIAPFNLLLDTRTMKVVLELEGDEPATLFGEVDAFFKDVAAE
jgi:hypothetical protein